MQSPQLERREIVITLPIARPGPRALEILTIAALVVLGVGLPFALAVVSGAGPIAHNDDFSYRKTALNLYQTGSLQFDGWGRMTLIGQVLFVQPFLWLSQGNTWAFAVATSLLATAGIVSAYRLARAVGSRSIAVFAVLSLIFFPGQIVDSVTFMSDVPAMATALLCLAMGSEALGTTGRRRWMLLAGSLAVGCFAFSIRQSALAAPVAVLVAATASDSQGRSRYLAAWIVTLLTCAGIWLAAASVPVQYQGPLRFDLLMVARLRYGAATLCLILAPAMALTLLARRRRWLRTPFAAGLAAGLFVFQNEIGAFLSTGTMPTLILGNVFGKYGYPGGVAAGYPPPLLDPSAWQLLNVLTVVAGVVGCGMLAVALVDVLRELRNPGRAWRSLGTTRGLLLGFVVLHVGGIAAYNMVDPIYDRYLWPLAAPLACLLLLVPDRVPADPDAAPPAATRYLRRAGMSAAAGLMSMLAVISLLAMLNAFAFDAAGWKMGEMAVNEGYAASTVDAGLAWTGYHAEGPADMGVPRNTVLPWYEDSWSSFHLCAVVSRAPLNVAGLELKHLELEAYRMYLFFGPTHRLYLYVMPGPGCP